MEMILNTLIGVLWILFLCVTAYHFKQRLKSESLGFFVVGWGILLVCSLVPPFMVITEAVGVLCASYALFRIYSIERETEE